MKGTTGIVFEGGGGRGAYQVGAWKYLHEKGLDKNVTVVSGTSAGALNASLFVGSNVEKAEQVWRNINPRTILTPKNIEPEDVVKWLKDNGFKMDKNGKLPADEAFKKAFEKALISLSLGIGKNGMDSLARMFVNHMRSDCLFSREGIVSLFNDGLDFNQIKNNKVECFATCVKIPDFKMERFVLNEQTEEGVKRVLLASSAIPVIFPSERINGSLYCDGGCPVVGDNIPIRPVYEKGVDTIIVIRLKRGQKTDRRYYPKARVIEIMPSQDLGNVVTGMLDFTPEGSARRFELGYRDAKNVFGV